jgi:hypothetical protein
MTLKFDRFKTRKSIEAVIANHAGRIRTAERELEDSRESLRVARLDPNANQIVLQLLEQAVQSMGDNLASIKQRYQRFREQQAQPSAAFPCGIASCQESA